ncbi:ABC transporter ATP-binding protein [Nodosilinea sp. P-1105]|uniref:ABC transporter ATP-binding protein n=1 Tax=Nodosilinea sp. P-1105 TaxID=2546229 RepID=UPI00197D7C7A|nr:ABC transporter ATP-binding protein [Nodosilinea sp. P-1105]
MGNFMGLVQHPQWSQLLSLFKDMVQVLLRHPLWLSLSIGSTVLSVSLEPSLALLGRNFVNQLQDDSTALEDSLVSYVLVFGGVLVGLGLIKFGDKVLNKIYDLRLIIALQRTYLERRHQERGAQDIARLLYDCDQAKGGMDILYKDAWKIVAGVVSVLVWQLSLAPEWLPALVLAVLPPVLIVLAFGHWIQRLSLDMLRLQGQIAASTDEVNRLRLFAHQETFFQRTIRLEFFKKGSEVLIDLLAWVGLLAVIFLASLWDIGLLPEEVRAGDLALFAVNLNLLSKPMGDIGKVYNKGREAYPALLRVLQPDRAIALGMEKMN